MDWKDLAGIVGKAAPVVGTLLGGPVGAAVGGLVADALGVEKTPDAVSSILMTNPDAYVKIQQLQTDAQVQLRQLSVTAENNKLTAINTQYAAEAADRDSARKLAAQQPNDKTRQIITFMLLAGCIGTVVMILGGFADKVVHDNTSSLMVGTVLGYLFNELKQVLGFWFGSTSDSSIAQQTITQFAVQPGTVTAPPQLPAPTQQTVIQSPTPVKVEATPVAPSNPGDIYHGS